NGTAAKWIGYKDQWSGIANIYVDGALKTQVDSYSASGQAQAVLYTITGLSSGAHTLTIEVTGNKNAAATSAWVWVDAFESAPDAGSGGVTGIVSRVEQDKRDLTYTGPWLW